MKIKSSLALDRWYMDRARLKRLRKAGKPGASAYSRRNRPVSVKI